MSSAIVLGLLDLLERPAAAIGDSGTILGSNQRFHELTRRHGRAPYDQAAGLLADESLARLMILFERGAGTIRERLELTWRDGQSVPVIIDVTPQSTGPRLAVVVVDAATSPSGGAGAVSALRHDIAGPLTAILGTAELLMMKAGDRLTPEVRTAFDQIVENCTRMTEILHRSRGGDRM